ncbi:MAG: hypothetical protein RDU30_03175 [Desulfovibrionaceae bacterium]|nr:hypothetical protein [Desulfovibrionaceae bacterium]
MNPDSLGPSPVDVSVLSARAWATALVFVLTGRRFGREPPGRAMFGHALPAAPCEAAAGDEADPWDAAMLGWQFLEPATADAGEAGMAFFVLRGHTDRATPRDVNFEGG